MPNRKVLVWSLLAAVSVVGCQSPSDKRSDAVGANTQKNPNFGDPDAAKKMNQASDALQAKKAEAAKKADAAKTADPSPAAVPPSGDPLPKEALIAEAKLEVGHYGFAETIGTEQLPLSLEKIETPEGAALSSIGQTDFAAAQKGCIGVPVTMSRKVDLKRVDAEANGEASLLMGLKVRELAGKGSLVISLVFKDRTAQVRLDAKSGLTPETSAVYVRLHDKKVDFRLQSGKTLGDATSGVVTPRESAVEALFVQADAGTARDMSDSVCAGQKIDLTVTSLELGVGAPTVKSAD